MTKNIIILVITVITTLLFSQDEELKVIEPWDYPFGVDLKLSRSEMKVKYDEFRPSSNNKAVKYFRFIKRIHPKVMNRISNLGIDTLKILERNWDSRFYKTNVLGADVVAIGTVVKREYHLGIMDFFKTTYTIKVDSIIKGSYYFKSRPETILVKTIDGFYEKDGKRYHIGLQDNYGVNMKMGGKQILFLHKTGLVTQHNIRIGALKDSHILQKGLIKKEIAELKNFVHDNRIWSLSTDKTFNVIDNDVYLAASKRGRMNDGYEQIVDNIRKIAKVVDYEKIFFK